MESLIPSSFIESWDLSSEIRSPFENTNAPLFEHPYPGQQS
jgi:hypothetical protein